MPCATSHSNNSLIPRSDETAVRVLGETGQTVVYIFPDGRGLAEREQPDFEAIADCSAPAVSDEDQVLEALIAAGKMSLAQKTVVMHDQQATGMAITEILTARGWI